MPGPLTVTVKVPVPKETVAKPRARGGGTAAGNGHETQGTACAEAQRKGLQIWLKQRKPAHEGPGKGQGLAGWPLVRSGFWDCELEGPGGRGGSRDAAGASRREMAGRQGHWDSFVETGSSVAEG